MGAGTGQLRGYRDIACACRGRIRKAKAHLELKLARGMEDSRKSFLHEYIGSKREAKESVGPFLSRVRNLVGREMCTSVPFLPQFSVVLRSHRSQSLLAGRVCGSEAIPSGGKDRARDHLTTWTCTSPWDQLGFIQGCQRGWLVSL